MREIADDLDSRADVAEAREAVEAGARRAEEDRRRKRPEKAD
jgi:hypothetical protein